ncbi:YfbU family protein [Pseudomonas chlororaphis]|uniref:YfbU family protein n=1 Tax=Pseudomonas chlororaphis TaxID=587753 RepID=UPI001E2F4403|nr:YfbU family protein [Pseudomonas chlororaphis]MCB2255983.1 YfbU family protein [Pseudomonas chlororaphis]
MEFSNEQKLIITLLTEIHAALEIKDGVDPFFVQEMVSTGHTWALRWRYPGIFEDSEETPQSVLFVVKVLDLWERLEHSFNSLSEQEREELVKLSPVYGKSVTFRGFDGNGEEGYSIAHILIEDMGRWATFKDRDLNAHMPMNDIYERMLEALDALPTKSGFDFELSVEEMAEILNAMIHPQNR